MLNAPARPPLRQVHQRGGTSLFPKGFYMAASPALTSFEVTAWCLVKPPIMIRRCRTQNWLVSLSFFVFFSYRCHLGFWLLPYLRITMGSFFSPRGLTLSYETTNKLIKADDENEEGIESAWPVHSNIEKSYINILTMKHESDILSCYMDKTCRFFSL